MKRGFTFYYDTLTLLVCVAGIALSIFLMNLGLTMLVVRLLFIGSWEEKWNNIKAQKRLLYVLLSLFAVHIIGILWTKDLNFGLEEIIRKIAFLIVPITILAISPLNKEIIKYTFFGFILALFIGTIWGSINFISAEYPNVRNLIPSTSHIRFSLNIVFAVLLLGKVSITHSKNLSPFMNIIIILTAIWFVIYLILTQAITGILILSIFLLLYVPYSLAKQNRRKLSYFIFVIYFLGILGSCWWVIYHYKQFFTPNKIYSQPLKAKTGLGNDYLHLTDVKLIENGNYIHVYCNYDEIKQSWKQRTGKDIGDNFEILLRYMNSISPYKDHQAFSKLNDQDIENIKNGIANKIYTKKFSFLPRLYKIFYQFSSYELTGKIKGFSEFQRLELWRNAYDLAKDNFWIGVGTGDFVEQFALNLCERNSELCGTGLKSHNQYLNIFILFGVFGFVIFLFWLFYPPIKTGLIHNYIYMSFLFIVLLSMLTEDTLDNLAGRMFYIFFASIMLFNAKTIKEFTSSKLQ